MIRAFLHVPFPEDLSDEDYAEAKEQILYLSTEGLLGMKRKTETVL